MLKKVAKKSANRITAAVTLVASQYNPRYVNAMLREARRELEQGGKIRVQVVRVPGAYEIPVVAAKLASRTSDRPDAIICLGVILRGETTHAQHIGEAVSMALANSYPWQETGPVETIIHGRRRLPVEGRPRQSRQL